MSCSSSCVTQDHESYAACLRSKSIRIAYANSANGQDYTEQKKWDRELQEYADARSQGVQPASTKTGKIREAMEISNEFGKPYDAARPYESTVGETPTEI